MKRSRKNIVGHLFKRQSQTVTEDELVFVVANAQICNLSGRCAPLHSTFRPVHVRKRVRENETTSELFFYSILIGITVKFYS